MIKKVVIKFNIIEIARLGRCSEIIDNKFFNSYKSIYCIYKTFENSSLVNKQNSSIQISLR